MSTNTKKSKSSEETLEKLRAFINEKGGIVKKEEFAALDVDYRKILEFVEAGTLVRIKNGYYTDRIDRFSEEELIARLFPDARLCMESALYAYGYIREKPYGWHLAVDKNTSKLASHRYDSYQTTCVCHQYLLNHLSLYLRYMQQNQSPL